MGSKNRIVTNKITEWVTENRLFTTNIVCTKNRIFGGGITEKVTKNRIFTTSGGLRKIEY